MNPALSQQVAAAVAQLLRDVIDIRAQVARLNQQPWAAAPPPSSGGGSSSTFFYCQLPAGVGIAAGGDTSASGPQTVRNGSGVDSSNATIKNVTGKAIPAASLVFCGKISTDTYGAISVACP